MTLAFPREGQTPILLSFQVSSFQMNPVTISMLSVHHYESRSRQSHYLQSSTGGSAKFSLERLFTALWTFPTMAFSFSSLVLWYLFVFLEYGISPGHFVKDSLSSWLHLMLWMTEQQLWILYLFLFLRSTRYFSRGRQPLHIPLPQSALVEANLSQYWFGEKQQLGSQRWFLIPHLLRARCVTLHIYSLSLGFCFLIGKMGALL